MIFIKRKIGNHLKEQLTNHQSKRNISDWAYSVQSELSYEGNNECAGILYEIYMMDWDSQFELSEEDLQKIADRLIDEGEREEMLDPIPSVNEKADDLGENWLLCPMCIDAWQTDSTYGMVECPKCMQIMHNPKWKKDL